MSIIKSYIEGNATKLNALKYNGSSPIITKDIPTTVDQKGHNSNQGSARIDDLTRFTKLFTRPEGLKHLANEALLSKAGNEGKYKDKTFVGKILAKVKDKAVSAVKLTASTLAQVPVNGTGTHFVKGFNGKTYKGPDDIPYQLGESDIINKIEKKFETALPPLESENSIETLINGFSSRLGFPTIPKVTGPAYFKKIPKSSIDSVNAITPRGGGVTNEAFQKVFGETKDIINFNFKVLGSNPDESDVTLYFRALLDSFNDDYGADWSGVKYIGRAETFHTYQGFNRSINLSFKVAAMTRAEMNPIYQKIVYLASTTAPTYSQDGFMRGTITKLTVGDYLVDQPGFVSSVNYSWDPSYPWEVKLKDSAEAFGVDEDVQQLPMVLDVNLQFEPIHTFAPQTGAENFFTNPVEDPVNGPGTNDITTDADFNLLEDRVNELRNTPKDQNGNLILTKRQLRKQKRLERKAKKGRINLEQYRRRGGL